LEEVAEVVAVDPGSCPALDKDEILEDPLDALNICGSLLTLSSQYCDELVEGDDYEVEVIEYKSDNEAEEIEYLMPSEGKRVITLAHYSVKEYLTSERIQKGPAKIYSLQENDSNIIIANSCIGYLLQFQDAESFCRETVETHKLAQYSAQFWTYHARSCTFNKDSTQKLVMKLFSAGDGAYLNWIRIHDLDYPGQGLRTRKQAADVAPPLYYASLAGLTESVRYLLHDVGADVNARGQWDTSALCTASEHGHETVVKLLIAAGADVNAHGKGSPIGNALLEASAGGHEGVVKLLLAAGVGFDVHGEGSPIDNAIQAASACGQEAVVKLLWAVGGGANA